MFGVVAAVAVSDDAVIAVGDVVNGVVVDITGVDVCRCKCNSFNLRVFSLFESRGELIM